MDRVCPINNGYLEGVLNSNIISVSLFCHLRYRARIRGLFCAITRPTPIGPIITQGHFQEKLFQCK